MLPLNMVYFIFFDILRFLFLLERGLLTQCKLIWLGFLCGRLLFINASLLGDFVSTDNWILLSYLFICSAFLELMLDLFENE